MCAYYVDIRFRYQNDNPFGGDNKSHRAVLINYMNTHQNDFKDFDPLETYHFAMLVSSTSSNTLKQFYGIKVPKYNRNVDFTLPADLKMRIQNTLLKIPEISPKLKEWAGSKVEVVEETNQAPNPEANPGEVQPQMQAGGIAVPDDAYSYVYTPSSIVPSRIGFGKISTSITTYDASTDRTITYEELQRITCNIARSRLTIEHDKDESVVRMEEEKRKELIREITSYREVRSIGAINDSDLTQMDIQQLEQCRDQCKKHFEHFKTVELFKTGSVVAGTVYDTIFPNGIPISKKKRIRLDGVGSELIEVLFDMRNTTGKAFSELLNKYNFGVSNEALLGIVVLSSIFKKIKIEDREDEEAGAEEEEEEADEDEDE